MIASIMVKDRYKLVANDKGNITIGDETLHIKEIPFIRYDFDNYVEADVNYIKVKQERFIYSTHLAQVELSENALEQVKLLKDGIGNIAIYIYINLTNEEVDRGEIDEYKQDMLLDITDEIEVDRIMLRDNTTNLFTVSASKIIEDLVELTGLEDDMFGICESPLSFGEKACLTAVKAREIMAKYNDKEDIPLPTANHQKGGCGCIQYIIVEDDIVTLDSGSVKKAKKQKEKKGEASKKPTTRKRKKVLTLGRMKF